MRKERCPSMGGERGYGGEEGVGERGNVGDEVVKEMGLER